MTPPRSSRTPAAAPCCAEYAAVSRRGLLTGALALAGTSTVVGSAVVRASAATVTPAASVLVVLSMRGAADGLSLVVPHADPTYYLARPNIAIPSDRLLAKDGQFGLHPELESMLPLWNAGKVAAVHATGLPAPNRSHFAAMEEVEDANPGSTTRVGWLNRLIGTDSDRSPLQGFNMGEGAPPASLYGPEDVMGAGDLDRVQVAGADQWDHDGGRRRSLEAMWKKDGSTLGRAIRSTFSAVDAFAPVHETSDVPANGATYPDSDLGRAMSAVARVVRGDVGVEVITVDQGDWDMHSDLGTVEWGRMNRNARELAGSISAFFTDLGPLGDKVTLVALSEFGRRVVENANYGLDHGYGNAMFLAGAGVKGGTYYGTWPGLSEDLDSDLLVTTDYRSVLSEVVASRFGASTSTVFPGFQREHVGVMQGQ
ncbi:DUF1501 domain-containing protein [Nocardioides sp. KIGAM211]|uniref:DUF1501 domain-containing protein n=1 Tax=Nocardioides luti TaxID=2761101 RepID=A0A7X0RCL7_9ACTN|nr:DUF1501 domain-containing protein [Nocardioides luti]MBB6625742.1 DUF1501 domain-containing protein [Nocardioides luti]